jgi:glycerol-3-phosphate dehydrogenase
MRRDLRALADPLWDVVVIGGGIQGACVAWDAVLRGLTVALVERSDFASATSANSMKIIHGGLRYLRDLDVRRMRASIAERRTLLRIAAHLVRPLAVVVPTYGHGGRGPELLRLALALNDLVGLDRNAGLDRAHRLPAGRTVSRRRCLELVPGLPLAKLTGAGIFWDAQVDNSERLVLAFLRSAAKAGAELANYVEVVALRRDRDGSMRVAVRDHRTNGTLALRARAVVNASGPWVDEVLGRSAAGARLGRSFVKAFNVVTPRVFPTHAVALPIDDAARDDGGLVRRGGRRLFVVPWRAQSLIGTWYERYDGRPDAVRITEADVARLLGAVNRACPSLALRLADVRLVHGGLVPLGESRLAKHGWIVDHAVDGAPGLYSVLGVKYTTARLMAERTVDRVLARLGGNTASSMSAAVPLHGADGSGPSVALGASAWPSAAGDEGRAASLGCYGSARGEVLTYLQPGEDAGDAGALLRAEIRHAIRAEMAYTLSDVVFRRTDLGAAGDPGPALLDAAVTTASAELGWTSERQRAELHQVHERFGVPR